MGSAYSLATGAGLKYTEIDLLVDSLKEYINKDAWKRI